MNKKEEMEVVLQIMRETTSNPEERERRLSNLARDHSICPGVVCKCDDGGKFCPRHGKLKTNIR